MDGFKLDKTHSAGFRETELVLPGDVPLGRDSTNSRFRDNARGVLVPWMTIQISEHSFPVTLTVAGIFLK